ncbi:MAG: serine--tRNA ligase [Gemmatimonadetes bacterium]|nr:serine--tRNA ligase [Gemmatimonadota bacterium]
MIDIKLLRQDATAVRAQLARRRDPALDAQLERLGDLERRRREVLTRAETLKAERNAASEEVARRKKAKEPADELLERLKRSAEEGKALDQEVREVEAALDAVLFTVPNLPLPSVPEGDASGNTVVKEVGARPAFPFAPKAHWDLGAALGLFDLPRGAKITGSGFPLFTGPGARLVRALKNFLLDLHTLEHGYTEIVPPLLVNRASMTATGQLPKFEEELYFTAADDLFLIPTAEVPVTNIHRDEILEAGELPKGLCAFTPCFRREAGAAGKDTRGLIRVHQFDKVELVRFCRPEESPAQHEAMTRHAETALERLGIPYRRLALAAGDLGFASACTYDLEVWAAGVGTWLEASSASTFTDFQARRAGIRFRREPGAKPEFVHTLNASGVAFPRTIIALLENNQQADGSVVLPPALVPYFGSERLVPRA